MNAHPHHTAISRWRPGLMAALVLASCAIASPGWAQDKGSREKEALRRAQLALRAAQDEVATLQRERAQCATDREAALKDKAEAQKSSGLLASAQAQSRQSQGRVKQLEGELEAVQQQLSEAKAQQTQQAKELGDGQRSLRAVRQLLETSEQRQRVLQERNQQLYDTGVAVVEMYRSRKPAETAAQQAVVLGFGLVDVENISEKWLDRLNAARFHQQDRLPPP